MYLVCVLINFYLLFFLSKRLERPLLVKTFIALIPAAVILGVLVMLLMKAVKFMPDANFTAAFFSIFFSIIVISMTNLANQLFSYMVDYIANFHQENNAANLNRQPIKAFVTQQGLLKRGAAVIWFLGSALMLYGVWAEKMK